MPNIQKKRVFSGALNQMVSLKVAASTIRDMEHRGGLDAFILGQPEEVLSKRALTLKNRIRRKLSGGKKAGA